MLRCDLKDGHGFDHSSTDYSKVAHKLMLALGYDQYGKLSVGIRLVNVLLITIVVAQGGDWGSRVSPWLY